MDVATIPPLRRPETTTLAAGEAARFADALRALDADDWTRPTSCDLWDVRAMAGHVLGMTETFTGMLTMARMMRAGRRAAGDGPMVDGLTAVQVEQTAPLTTDELIDRLDASGPIAARWRTRRHPMRLMRMGNQDPGDGTAETWTMAYLLDVILTRDTWMHRSDLAEAVGVPMTLTAEHDGRLVSDVVAEWARRHGQPFTLHLTGAAGGLFRADGTANSRDHSAELTMDAVEFCRVLSGRGDGTGLLAQPVPF